MKKLAENIDLNSIDGRAQFIDKSRRYISELPKGQFRQLLMQEVGNLTKTQINFSQKKSTAKIQSIDQWTPVRKSIAILVNQPNLVINFPNEMEFEQLKQNGVNILTEIIEICRLNPNIQSAALIEHFRNGKAYSHLSALLTVPLNLNREQLLLELEDIKKYFEKSIQKAKIDSLRYKKSTSGLSDEEKIQLVELLTNQIK